MDISTVSFIIGIILASIQIIRFIQDWHTKHKNAKKEEVNVMSDDIENKFESIKMTIEDQDDRIQYLENEQAILKTEQAVINERVNNEKNDLIKIERKIDSILEKI